MDHPFLTRRTELRATEDALRILSDICTILSIQRDDKSLLLQRKEVLIKDEGVRRSICRRADRLGLLLEDVDKLSRSELHTSFSKEWYSFLVGSSEVSDKLSGELECVARRLRTQRDELTIIECDDRSSSYSDYSASDTMSTEDEDTDETEQGEEDVDA